MKALPLTAVLVALTTSVASADELAREGNILLATQIADTVTTRIVINHNGGFERDPIARPFVHSNLSAGLATVAVNELLRVLFRHSPKTLRFFSIVELGTVGVNIAASNHRP